MKILYVNTVCGSGSTGKITADLYKIAQQNGQTPFIAYGRGTADRSLASYKIGNAIDFGCHVLTNFFFGKSGFGSKTVTKRFLKWLDEIKPDLLHLHNLHGFYIHIGIFFDYIKSHNIPVVWTLHDCWPLTGQCAFFDYANCSKWQTLCHNCPVYRKDYPYSLFKDNSKWNYYVKRDTFSGIPNLTIVAPSNWLADIVCKSFLNEYPVKVIPNGIDLGLFTPANTQVSNNIIQNSCSPKIVLGVANVWTRRKGLNFFLQLANMLDDSFHIVLIGVSKQQQSMIATKYKECITAITRTSNQEELVSWYQRAYVFVNPTLEDNFPTTNLEALACGTPVITFNTGGSPESINDTCGIVVEKGNVTKLKEAILSLDSQTKITSSTCTKQAKKYDKNTCFAEYINLYSHIIS